MAGLIARLFIFLTLWNAYPAEAPMTWLNSAPDRTT